MYRIDFINSNNAILHSLTIESGLDNINISAEKITGSDFFAKEPKRIEFTHPLNDWINQYIMSGNYEYERFISHFRVRFYAVQTGHTLSLQFTGVIDTSFLAYNEEDETVSFVAYDYIKLLSVYSDQKMLYALVNGYHPGYCFGYLVQRINQKLPFNIQVQWNGTYTVQAVNAMSVQIASLPWKEHLADIRAYGLNPHENFAGFGVSGGFVTFQIFMSNMLVSNGQHSVKIFAKTYIFYNNICVYEDKNGTIDTETNKYTYENMAQLTQEINKLKGNRYQAGSVMPSISHNINTYTSNVSASAWISNSAPDHISINFTGNPVPANLFPRGFYDGKNEQTEMLKVLKAALVLHNLTITCNNYGVLTLCNKNDLSVSGVAININTDNITEFNKKRKNREEINPTILDCLMGDSKALKDYISEYYNNFLTQIWEINITVSCHCEELADEAIYSFKLFDIIKINGVFYKITSLRPDLNNESIEIIAWEV